MTDWRRPIGCGAEAAVRRTAVSAELPVLPSAALPSRRRSVAGLLATAGAFLAGCSGNSTFFQSTPTPQTQPQTTEAPPPGPSGTVGAGEVKAALILPVSATGNAARRVQRSQCPASGEGRRGQHRRGAARGAAGPRRGGRHHPRAALCAI